MKEKQKQFGSHRFYRPLRNLLILLAAVLCLFSAGCGGSAPEPIPVQISYDSAAVSYLGPEGTYTQEACAKFFEKQGQYLPYPTVNEAVEAMISGECNYAVIPQENTIGGAVIDYVDTLIQQDKGQPSQPCL